jgi:hypothetical protein
VSQRFRAVSSSSSEWVPDRADICFGAREIVVDTRLGGHMVRADPHLAAGPCGCASDLVAGVEDNGSATMKSDR